MVFTRLFGFFVLLFTNVQCACPDNWYRSGDYCYWVFNQLASFEASQVTCELKDSSLGSLSTSQDLNASMTVLSSQPSIAQVWTALVYDSIIGRWVYLDYSTYNSTLTPWWGGQEPNPVHVNGAANGSSTSDACAMLDAHTGQLHRSSCTDPAAPLCRRDAYRQDQCKHDDGWSTINNACYKTFTEKQSWWDAQQTCSRQSSTLLTLPFTSQLWTVVQQSVRCDTADNDVWIDTNITAGQDGNATTQCNYVSVVNGPVVVQESCLQENKFLCTKPTGTCGPGFFNANGRCYFNSNMVAMNWINARQDCQNKGAQLIVVSDAGEEQWLEGLMQRTLATAGDTQLWIGLSDTDVEGQLVWVDGSPVTANLSYWANDSSNTDLFDCVVTKAQVGMAARWATDYCFRQHPYLCEMDITQTVLNVTSAYACEAGWTSRADKCYKLFGNKTYDEGKSLCASYVGSLATEHSLQDQANIAAIMPGVSFAWIGLRKDALSSQFVWADDGTVAGLTNWLPGEPNHVGSGEDCVQVVGAAYKDFSGAWNDNDCSKRMDCICQKNAKPVSVASTTAPNGNQGIQTWSPRCGPGWLLSDTLSSCYQLVSGTVVPWSAARGQCQGQGGDLVSITHAREQAQIEAMITNALASASTAGSGVWIGASDYSQEGGWEWSDAGPFRYLHWSDGQPDDSGVNGGEQDCVVVVPADSMRWDDRDCGELHNYLCKKPALPKATPPPFTGPTQPPGECRGWTLISGEYSVADSQLVASSSVDSSHDPSRSRIYPGNTAAWQSAGGESAPWLGVVFETQVTVKGVITTGGLSQQAWVTHFSLRYRYDADAPQYWYSEAPGSGNEVFTANNDSSSEVTNALAIPFAAREVYLYPSGWIGHSATIRWELLGCLEDECTPEYAVSGPLIISDNNLTASSVSDPQHDTVAARLRGLSAAWVLSCWRPAALDTSQWIQADFGRVEVLRGITTRGNPQAKEWVISYLLLYQPPTGPITSFKPYEEPYGTVQVFTGNSDSSTLQTNIMKSHVPTRHVRLQPQDWFGYIALQFDLLVCESGCQEQPLLSKVSDEQLTATSSNPTHGPGASRMGSTTAGGGWEAMFQSADQYIQVSLDVPLEVRAVATQGRQNSRSWVTSYYLTWSTDAVRWTNYSDTTNNSVIFLGNFDPDLVHKYYLPTPIIARALRLHPVTWQGAISLRWELYGCPGKNSLQPIGCYSDNPNDRDLPYEPYIDAADGMDPVLCTRHCFNKGYYYAGLQVPDQCYCGNTFGRYGVSADCNTQCFPRQEFQCGGFRHNYVYATGLTSAFKVCPTGWKALADQCYSFNNTPLDWVSARAACGAVNATLASVSDSNVNSLLFSLVGAATNQSIAWIGLNDMREQRYYVWSNNEEVVHTNWDVRQPPPLVTGETSRCVGINSQTGGWRVADCSRRLPYFCRGAKRTSDQPAIVGAPQGCQQGMLAYQASCYVLTEEGVTKADADDVCATFNGHLVVVDDRLEQAYVMSLLSSHQGTFWTDVSDLHDPGRFTFSAGTRDVTYTNWAPLMPDSHRQGHCVTMGTGTTAGLWVNVPCPSTAKCLCEIPREGVPQPPVTPSTQRHACAVNWVDGNSTLCYQINNVGSHLQRSWVEARADCQEQRGELASFPSTALLQDFWRQKLVGSSNHFWFGLYTLPAGVLEWVDTSPVNLDGPWGAGQPSTNNGTATCVELHVTSGTLALQDCGLKRNWLCSIQRGVTPFQRLQDRVSPTAGPPGSCLPLDDTWKRFQDNCYTVYTAAATWRQARAKCQASGADLASIRNIQDNMFILTLAQKVFLPTVWLGLSELMSDAGYYSWSDGSVVSFLNWDSQGPDDANGQESCVEMFSRTGRWNDNHCAMARGFVCKRNVSPMPPSTPPTTPAPQGGCEDGFVLYGDRCYIVLGQQGLKTWQQAADDCMRRSTFVLRVQLASVRSHAENAFLNVQLLSANWLAWIGLRLVNQTFLWMDNEDLTYTNWDTGEPNGGQREPCVHMYSRGANAGQWNDVDCNRPMGYVCESRRYSSASIPTTAASNCPSGFERLGTSCYLYRATQMTWDQAEVFCASQKAHLVSVGSQTEQDFVYLMVLRDPLLASPSAWIGLKATQVGGQETRWSWTDGWPVTYSRWSLSGDLGSNSTDYCVSMDGNGTWSTRVCSENRPFVCKITSDTLPYSPVPGAGYCEGGQNWVPFNDHCYSFHLQDRVTFARAVFACGERGAALASIHDNDTNAMIQAQVKAGSTLPVWIGFRRSETGGYTWRDGSAVDFTNWAVTYPRGNNSDGIALRCAQLSAWNGQWLDEECTAQNGFVCSKQKVYEASPTSPTAKVTVASTLQTTSPSSARSSSSPVQTTTATARASTPLPQRTTSTARPATSHVTPQTTWSTTLWRTTTTMATTRTTTAAFSGSSGRYSGQNDSDVGSDSGAIAGGVLGGIVVLLLVVVALVWFIRRHRQQSHAGFTSVLYQNTAQEVHIDTLRTRLDTADELSMP